VLFYEPYLCKAGTKDSGQKWTQIAEKINTLSNFSTNPRDQRNVREHFNRLLADYKQKINEEEAASGISPDPLTSENEKILEDIVERLKSAPDPSTKKDEKKREVALNIRDKAMKTWSKAEKHGKNEDETKGEGEVEGSTRRKKRRGSSDTLQYLAEKSERESELKKQELELRREELRLQAEHQREQIKIQQEQMKLVVDVLSQLKK